MKICGRLSQQKDESNAYHYKRCLKFAACFGMRVDIELLGIIVKKFATFLPDLPSLRDALEVALTSNLVVVNTDFTHLKFTHNNVATAAYNLICLLYTSPSPRDGLLSRMPSSA